KKQTLPPLRAVREEEDGPEVRTWLPQRQSGVYSATMDNFSPCHGGSVFAVLVGASQVLGLVSVVLTGVWMGHYRGGFAWDGSAQEFNLHPLCMVLGLIFLHGDDMCALALSYSFADLLHYANKDQMPTNPTLIQQVRFY
ncbi:hypothetical protein CHARACLAT_028792, partial [Characodon lateralis]|nr:hypothetical protein [Characodon lateralis]